MWPIRRMEQINRNAPAKELITDLRDKDFKTTDLKILKQLKKDVQKVSDV